MAEEIELGPITRQQLEIRLQDIAESVQKLGGLVVEHTEALRSQTQAIGAMSENLGKWIAAVADNK